MKSKALWLFLCVCICLMLTIHAASAYAEEFEEEIAQTGAAKRLLGDADSSGAVDIMDATAIQRYLAELIDGSEIDFWASDASESGETDILDATNIQLMLAELGGNKNLNKDAASLLKPDGLAAGEVGSRSVLLCWNAPAGLANSYRVYSVTASGGYQYIATVKDTCYTVEGLEANSSYGYAVRAVRNVLDEKVVGDYSSSLSVTTMAPTAQDLTLTTASDRAYLTWSASPGAEGYDIYYDKGDGMTFFGTTKKTEFRDKNLSSGTAYTFYVKTYKTVGGKKTVSSDSAEISGRTLPGVPTYTVSKENGVFNLNWKRIKGADWYEVITQLPEDDDWSVAAQTAELSCSFEAPDSDELFIAVRAVSEADGIKYRGDYRKQLYSEKATGGTIGVYGDSIARGLGSHYYSFSEMIGYERGLGVDNRAVSSATLCYAEGRHCIYDDVLNYVTESSDYDYVILEGGYNDYNYSCPLGYVTPKGTKSFDTSTALGALEASIVHIKNNCPDAKLVFVLVHNVTNSYTKKNSLGLTFADYCAGMRSVCTKYGATVADCSTQMKTSDTNISRLYTSSRFGVYPNGDGLHPNEDGYKRWYVPVIESALFG